MSKPSPALPQPPAQPFPDERPADDVEGEFPVRQRVVGGRATLYIDRAMLERCDDRG